VSSQTSDLFFNCMILSFLFFCGFFRIRILDLGTLSPVRVNQMSQEKTLARIDLREECFRGEGFHKDAGEIPEW